MSDLHSSLLVTLPDEVFELKNQIQKCCGGHPGVVCVAAMLAVMGQCIESLNHDAQISITSMTLTELLCFVFADLNAPAKWIQVSDRKQ